MTVTEACFVKCAMLWVRKSLNCLRPSIIVSLLLSVCFYSIIFDPVDVVIKACPMQNIHNICKRNVVCKSPRSSSVIEEGPLEAYSRLSRDSSPHVIKFSLQFNSTLRPSVLKVSLAQACTKGWVGRLWPTSLKLEPNHQGASKS